jgi:hypothetical protein
MSQSLEIGIATGEVSGSTARHVYGINDTVGASQEDVSELGVATIPLPSSAEFMEVVSTSAQDGVAGTGVLTVEIHGLDSNYDLIEEDVILDGTTPVETDNSYIRINKLHALTVGSSNSAVGIISLQKVSAGTEYIRISPNRTSSLQAHFTIPADNMGILTGWSCSASGITRFYLNGTAHSISRELLDGVYIPDEICMRGPGGSPDELSNPVRYPARADIKVTAESLTGGDTIVSASFEMFIEQTIEAAIEFLLLETGDFLLQETGDKLIL